MTLVDQGFLLAAGLFALYLCFIFYRSYNQTKKVHNIYYLASFAVLLVAGLLLIFLSYDILTNPIVVIASTLIPLTLALGLVTQFYPKQEKYYLLFVLVGLILIVGTRVTDTGKLGTMVLALIHSVAGLTVFSVPIMAAKNNWVTRDFIGITIGGALIGVGGIALGFLKAGKPLLFFTEEVIFFILAPLLFLMTASFAHGFVRGR